MQLKQADQFTGYRRRRFPDVKGLRGLPEIDGYRCEIQRPLRLATKTRRYREKVENFVTVIGVAPEAGTPPAQ